MAHTSGNPTWTNTAATPINATALENLESNGDFSVPTLKSTWLPSDNGLLTYSFDPGLGIGNVGLGGGQIFYVAVKLGAAASVTGIAAYLNTANTALTSGGNWAGLYTAGGLLLGTTADQTTSWGSTGPKLMPFSAGPQNLGPGRYTVALQSTATANALQWSAMNGYGAPMTINAPNPLAWRSSYVSSSGATTLPSNQITPTGGLYLWWAGLY